MTAGLAEEGARSIGARIGAHRGPLSRRGQFAWPQWSGREPEDHNPHDTLNDPDASAAIPNTWMRG